MKKSQVKEPPISKAERDEYVAAADRAFERILVRIEARHPQATRALWDAESYVDEMIGRDPPMRRYDIETAIDAFLVHEVIGLATAADQRAKTKHLN